VAITPAAIKSSAGAWVHLRIARCCKGASAIEDLKQAGYWIAALAPEGAVTVYDLDTARRLVRVVGSEGRGVREILKKGGLCGADPYARPDRVIERFGGGGAGAVRHRTPARRDSGGAAAGTTVGANAVCGRTGITDRGCSSATAQDRYSVRPLGRRTADGVCGARRECASLRQESVTSRNSVLHRKRI
jgi:hypothetical protein